jgi:hypothetical protein
MTDPTPHDRVIAGRYRPWPARSGATVTFSNRPSAFLRSLLVAGCVALYVLLALASIAIRHH